MPSPLAMVQKHLVGHLLQCGSRSILRSDVRTVVLAQAQSAQRHVLRNCLAGTHHIADQHGEVASDGRIVTLFSYQKFIDVGESKSHAATPGKQANKQNQVEPIVLA